MRYIYRFFFEAPRRWEKTIDHGLLYSMESFLIVDCILLDLISIQEAWRHYGLGSIRMSTYFGLYLLLFLLLIVFSSFSLASLFHETRERLNSGVIDEESRRTLLNVSFIGYRLYATLLVLPASIFWVIRYLHP